MEPAVPNVPCHNGGSDGFLNLLSPTGGEAYGIRVKEENRVPEIKQKSRVHSNSVFFMQCTLTPENGRELRNRLYANSKGLPLIILRKTFTPHKYPQLQIT